MTDRLPFVIECSGSWEAAVGPILRDSLSQNPFKLHSFTELHPEIDFECGSLFTTGLAETLEELALLVSGSTELICKELAAFVGTGYLGDDLSYDLLLPLMSRDGPLEGLGAFSSPAHVLAAHQRFRLLNVRSLMEAYKVRFPERIPPHPNYYKNPIDCTVHEFASAPLNLTVYTAEVWESHNNEQAEPEFEAFYMRVAQWLFLVESASNQQRGICFASM